MKIGVILFIVVSSLFAIATLAYVVSDTVLARKHPKAVRTAPSPPAKKKNRKKR